jgi:hypothetical protein
MDANEDVRIIFAQVRKSDENFSFANKLLGKGRAGHQE